MHLADGIVSTPLLLAGSLLAAGGVAIGLKETDYDELPRVAVLAAGFFVASLIHIPLGPGQIHLVLNGLLGLLLGWAAFPALLIALFLQAVLFGYGGISVLGLNTLNMALPGILCFYLFTPFLRQTTTPRFFLAIGLLTGLLAIGLSGLMLAATLYLSDPRYAGVSWTIIIAHLPLMAIEGLLTGLALVFFNKTAPQLFRAKENDR